MTKLQKRPPPAYPGLSTNTISLEGGIRYETLAQDTRQPIPLNPSDSHAAVSGALGSNNPYNAARFEPQHPLHHVFSPVSPMDAPAAPQTSVPTTHIHAPQPHRQSMDARKSVDLRRLDGSPYKADQPKKVKVAKDMHEGALPPAYKRTASDPIHPTEVTQALTAPARPAHDCSKCGRRRQTLGQEDQTRPNTCTKCNKHASSESSAPHSRAVSQAPPSVPHAAIPTSPTIAGPSAMAPGPQNHPCHKCGKKKKPATAPIQQQPFRDVPQGPSSAPLSGVRITRPARPGISIQQAPNLMRGINPQIDVIPPSASTYRPHNTQSPFSQYGDETPLVERATKQEYSIFRNSSNLVRSLSRRMSGKDKRVSSDGPLPSQQLRASQMENGEQGTGRLITMLSKAINDSGDDPQYARLSAQEQASRPSSPFSFMETPNVDEGYELKEMGGGKGKTTSPTSPETIDSIYSPIVIEETLDVDVDRRSRSMEQQQKARADPNGLGVPGQDRPQLTRFKSLRQGVNRAASVTRATSLRRLDSLKTVHTAWYRDDMAIEGHNGETVPVF